MPRVSRNYQYQDFSHLLTPQQVHAEPKTKKQKQPAVITPEKRRRDSLMANRKMRYVLSHTGKIHDRDCLHAVQIPDEAFDMCEDYPNGRYVCFVCYRKALVRKGLALDQTKYIDAAMRVFHEVGATNSDLNMLFLKYNAQIYHVEADSVYLKVNEDCWIVETAPNGCMLYHNNYQVLDDFQRLMESGFHPQADRVITFRNALITMCQYTWEGHIQAMEAKRKVQRQEALRQRLSSLSGHQMTTKLSVFFRYFLLAVPANYPEQLPCRTIKREVHQFGDLCLCRVPKWKSDTIDAIENSIKTYIDRYIILPENKARPALSEDGFWRCSGEEFWQWQSGETSYMFLPSKQLNALEEQINRTGTSLLDPLTLMTPQMFHALYQTRCKQLPQTTKLAATEKTCTFDRLVRIDGIGHGSFTQKQQELFRSIAFGNIPATREDIWNTVSTALAANGVRDDGFALLVMEHTRKGLYHSWGIQDDHRKLFSSLGLPEWYPDYLENTLYLFPKGHCIAHLLIDALMCWYSHK